MDLMRKHGAFIYAFTLVVGVISIVVLMLCGCDQKRAPKKCCPGPCPPSVQVFAFTAKWCVPCHRIKPILVSIQVAGVDVRIIDVDEQPDVARANGVTSVPTFLVRIRTSVERTQDIAVVLRLLGRAKYDR